MRLRKGAIWLMAVLFGSFEGRAVARDPEPSLLVELDVTPPGPRLETQTGQLLRQLRALERVQLEGYAWLDRENGVARIPVQRAKEILAETGLPHRDSGSGTNSEGEE